MTASSHTGVRRTLQHATHSLGALVLISLISTLIGAVTGYIGHATGHAEAVANLLNTIFRAHLAATDAAVIYSCLCGVLSGMTGGTIGGVALIVGTLSSRLRTKITGAFERAGIPLTLLAITSGVCAALYWILVAGELADNVDDSSGVNFLLLGVMSGAWGAVLGLIVGVLIGAVLVVGVAARILTGLLSAAFTPDRSASADLIGGTDDPWPIRAAAALMPPEYGRRWRDDFAEAQYDHGPDQHPTLLLDFLLHAPAVIAWAWIATLQRNTSRAGDSSRGQR